MASLSDIVSRHRKRVVRGPDGQLVEQNQPTVQQLAGQAGLPAAPIDPLSTAAIGGNPHQQKMAGTPNQTSNALRQSLEPSERLQDTDRRQQARTATTAEEQQSQEKSRALQDLGQLGDRVDSLIKGQMAALQATTVGASDVETTVPTSSGPTGLPRDPAQLGQLKNSAKQLLANPTDMQALLQVNQLLGRDPNSLVTPTELQSLYETSADTLARSGAANVQNDLQVEDLLAAGDFPYTLPELSELLEVPADQLAKYSVKQIQDQLDTVAEQEFTRTAAIEQQATSNRLGQAERGLARGMARDASATGQRASEADVARLEQSIAAADQVSFGGQQYGVEELLRDETISGIIKSYFDNPSARVQLEATEPGMVEWIKRNEAVLGDASQALEGATESFSNIQKQNLELGTFGKASIAPDLLAKLVPEVNKLHAGGINPGNYAVLAYLNGLNPAIAEKAVQGINAFAQANPDLVDQLGQLTPEEWQKLGLWKPNSPALTMVQKAKDSRAALDSLSAANPDQAIQTLTAGQFSDMGQVQDAFLDNLAASVLGLGGGNSLDNFDRNHDGRLDSVPDLISHAKQSVPEVSLSNIVAGKFGAHRPLALKEFTPPAGLQSVFDKVKGFTVDGKITPDEIRQANLSEDEIYSAIDGRMTRNWDPATQKALENQLYYPRRDRTNQILDSLPTYEQIIAQWRSLPPGPESEQKMAAAVNAQADSLAQKIAEFRSTNSTRKIDLPLLEERLNYLRQVAANFK